MKHNNETNKLTENSQETLINEMILAKVVFSIPYFQRPYKWAAEKKLAQFNKDILSIIEESNDFHFLGAIIYDKIRSNILGAPATVSIIDGQQRITTIFLYLAAGVKALCINKHYEDAKTLFDSYIIIPGSNNLTSNIKLHSCKQDRAQLNSVIDEILNDQEFRELTKNQKVKRLHSYGESHSIVKKNFDFALHFLNSQYQTG
jgi:uncharacterized protein with ParB-like and HNH nuclease domain